MGSENRVTTERRCKICGNRWMTPIAIDDIDESAIPDELVGQEEHIVDILYCKNCEFVSFGVDNCIDCNTIQ